jgi:hypothetical protein
MNHFSIDLLARQRQNELVEEGLREALLRRSRPALGQRHFALVLIQILGVGLAVIVTQIAQILGY